LVEKGGAKSTDYQNLESAKEYSDKCVDAADAWAKKAVPFLNILGIM
jgi:hypothetical protein